MRPSSTSRNQGFLSARSRRIAAYSVPEKKEEPKPAAAEIKDRVAFWKGVTVER